jgi:uncharacterized protein (DUF433 family)
VTVKNNDPRLAPILTVSDAAQLIGLKTPKVLYDWMRPTKTRGSLIHGVTEARHRGWPTISVIGLAEAHTAYALRTHGWSMYHVIDYVKEEQKKHRFPLATPRLVTDGVDVFVEQHDELARLWDNQAPFSEVVAPWLVELVPWDDAVTGTYRPRQLDPDLGLVEVDPRFNGGQLSFTRNRVPLSVIAGALSSGDDLGEVADDFRLTHDEVALVERNLDWFAAAA